MEEFKKRIALVIYYGIARFLPASVGFGVPMFLRRLSKKIRYIVCKAIFKECGKNVNIERGAYFGSGKELVIGDNSGLGINCHVHPNTIIGKNVMMGPNCYMLNSAHIFDKVDVPIIDQGMKKGNAQVIIEDDVWIGQDVTIVSDKTIKKGTIIGACCVLTKNFPEFSIVGGNPSKLLRSRLT